jgi:nucleotidyltransferase-like protein
VIAESDDSLVVESDAYFPPQALQLELVRPSCHTSVFASKGMARYYRLEVDGQVIRTLSGIAMIKVGGRNDPWPGSLLETGQVNRLEFHPTRFPVVCSRGDEPRFPPKYRAQAR